MMLSTRFVELRYALPARCGDATWELSDETMPESVPHDEAVDLVRNLLAHWARSSRLDAFVARNLAVRWDERHPQVGVDPDVALFQPTPKDARDLSSVRTWLPEHEPPLLALEVVSESHPYKDYVVAPEKYAASGTRELWIFDPLLAGPKVHGGPYRLQVWSRRDQNDFMRLDAGEGPAFSPVLQAWLVVTHEGRRLRIADEEAANHFWLTAEEAERAAKERERVAKEAALAAKEAALAAKEAALAAKEAALARIAELEARLKA